ncbi:TPA: hypothetical protein ACH3X1_000646 [Trebouxia sp. C0004]
MLLGYFSDTYGRKPILILSSVTSMIFIVGFGASTTYTMAILMRLAGGLCNFTFGCVKSMIGESMDLGTQAKALGYLSLAWGLGTILGPLLGGALSAPCKAYGSAFPFCQPGQLFIARPFLLPCLAAGVLSFMASLASMLLLKETLPSKLLNNYSHLTQDAEQCMKANSNSPAAAHKGIEMSTQYSSLQVEDSAADLDSDSNVYTIKQADEANCNVLCDALQQPHGQGTPAELAGLPHERYMLERAPMYRVHASEVDIRNAREHAADDLADAADRAKPDDEQTLVVSVHNDCGREHASNATAGIAKDSSTVWYQERAVQVTVIGYGLIAFIYNTADELTPLFAAASPAVGGAGLLANQLAVPLGFCGIVLMLYAVLGYPKCLERYGAAMSCRLGLLATAPLILATPIAYYVSGSVLAAQLVLCLILGIRIMAETNAFSSSLIMVKNAAPKHAIGKVNGSGQMLASLVRALGPALAGVLWGSSIQLNIPGHQFIPFAALSIVAAGTQFIYVVLKPV